MRKKATSIQGEWHLQDEANAVEHVGNDATFYDSELDLNEDDNGQYGNIDGFDNGQCSGAESEEGNPTRRSLDKLNGKIIYAQKEAERFEGEDLNIVEECDSFCSDSLPSNSSESENEGTTRLKYPKYRREVVGYNPVFEIGMEFGDAKQFKDAIREHKIKEGKLVKFAKNSLDRIKAFCVAPNCGWYISACNIHGQTTFKVQSLMASHNCGRSFYHRGVTSKYLANRYLNDFKANMRMKLSDFQDKVRTELNVNITRNQFYKTKEKVKGLIEGTYKDQYVKLWDYIEELRRISPESTIILKQHDDSEVFHRLYICLEACKKGFLEGCRPIFGVDGCHLRGSHPGILLTAVGIDPNNCIYPVAYAVVEAENKDAWIWFIESLIQDLHIYPQERWTIISDRQKGLMPALADLLPNVEHRHCVRHLYCNFKKLHPGLALKDMVWKAARATYVAQFQREMEALKCFDEKAYQWFVHNTHPIYWSRSHFSFSPKCDILLNNLCESFNSVILDARERPIIWMLEGIRRYLLRRMQCKREWIEKQHGFLCPKIQKKLEVIKVESSKWASILSGNGELEVENIHRDRFKVNLNARTCSCRKWELTGIPCPHAVSGIRLIGQSPEQYVDSCYTRDMYLKAYKYIIPPIDGFNNWPISSKKPVEPPPKITLPGRPKKARRREPDEVGKKRSTVQRLSRAGRIKIRCTRCNQIGHNMRTCVLDEQDGNSDVPSFRLNKCTSCGELGHNRRTCHVPTNTKTTEQGGAQNSLPSTGLNHDESIQELLIASQIVFSESPTHG